MEPTVRNPRIESALASEAARSSPLGAISRAPAGQFRPEIQSPGTEFLDAETGGQKSPVRRLMSAETGNVEAADDYLLSIPWQKPPSRKSRQILIPHGIPESEIRPTRIQRRARLVSAIARGRRWLGEIVSGSVTDVQQIASRQKCSVRQVNMTISLAFLAPDLVRAAVEGRLPRGIGVERLRDASAEWSQQFEALGLNPR
jgi:site-specific DNA recombinase